MLIQKLRLQRGWSQEQLAELSGLSVRTIQRVENGNTPSIESLKSLASVFEIEFSTLLPKPGSITDTEAVNQESKMSQLNRESNPLMQGVSRDEVMALRHVRAVRGFYFHAVQYVVIISGLVLLNWVVSPHKIWAIYPALGWGTGLAFHAYGVFGRPLFFGADWEKRQVEKILKRPL